MNYLTVKETSEILGLPTNKINYLISRGIFLDTKKENRKLFIAEIDILNYKKHLEFLDTLYSFEEVSLLLGFGISNLQQHYVKNSFFSTLQKINNKFYVTKDEIDNLLEVNKSFMEMKNYMTTKETATYLHLHTETILKYINKGYFPNALKSSFSNSTWRIPRTDIISFKKTSPMALELKNKYYKIEQVAKYYGIKKTTVHEKIRMGIFRDVLKGKTFYINKEEVHSLPINKVKKEILSPDVSLEERVNYYLQSIKDKKKISETINIFNQYMTHVYSNTKSRRKDLLINNYCNMLLNLSSILIKELHEYTDEEIVKLIGLTTKYKKYIIYFLNFTSATKSTECVFKSKYNFTTKKNNQKQKEVYSRKEFKKFYNYVKNVELHKEKALLKQSYAETWFYVFMHMTNAWRSSDILHFPLINLIELSDEYIKSTLTHDITISEGQAIVNLFSDQWEKFVINKTGVLNKFLVNIDMVKTASIILLIIESHKRKKSYDNSNYLLALMQKKTNINSLINSFFKDEPSLKPFSSRIANRSLMTYFFHSVSKGSKNGDVAHLLARRLRRHINEDTVSHYVMNTNEDEYLDDSSFNLFRRGHFGWLYNSLVDIVVNKKELNLTMEEKTRIIELYQKQYSPFEVENISTYFLEQHNNQKSIALEVALLTNKELENKLYSIYQGYMPSKEENSQCFYSENCKFPSGNCKICPYIIPRTNLLISLKNDISFIVEDIAKLDEYDINERIRKTHILYKFLGLLNQAIISFDRDYINSFIPLNELREKLEAIDGKVLLTERN